MSTLQPLENHKLVLPEHLNQFGFLFGGYLLKWVDEVAWIAASLDFPKGTFVTVGLDDVSFTKSVRKGTILTFRVKHTRSGTTSVQYHVEVFSQETSIFSTHVTFVHVDNHGAKQPLPGSS